MKILTAILLLLISAPAYAQLHSLDIYLKFTTSARRTTANNMLVSHTSTYARLDEMTTSYYNVSCASETSYGYHAEIRITDINKNMKDEIVNRIASYTGYITWARVYYHKCRHDIAGGCCDAPVLVWSKP